MNNINLTNFSFKNNYDMTSKDYAEKKATENLIEKARNKIYSNIQEKIDDKIQKIKTYSFETYDNVSTKGTVNNVLNTEQMLESTIKNKGNIIAVDTETMGNLDTNPANFVTTEYAINKVTFKNNKYANEPVERIVFGIPNKMSNYYQKVIAKAKLDYGSLTKDEQVIIDRLVRYSGNFDYVFKPVVDSNNVKYYTMRNTSIANKYDINKAQEGFENLLKLGQKGQAYTQTKNNNNPVSQYLFEKINKYIKEANEQNNIFMGYNSKSFDEKVTKHVLQMGNISNTNIKNHYDLYEQLSFVYDGKLPLLHEKLNSVNHSNYLPKSGYGKLEEFAKSAGYDVLSHEGGEDITVTVDLALDDILGENKNIHTDLLERLKDIKANNNSVPIKSNEIKDKVLFANKSMKLEPLDFIVDIDNNIKKPYISYGINSGHYYQINDYYHMSKDNIPNEIFKIAKDNNIDFEKGLNILELEDKATNVINKHNTYIVRPGNEQINKAIQENFDVLHYIKTNRKENNVKEVTQKTINEQTASKVVDNARRSFLNGFQVHKSGTANGFNYLDSLYSSFNSINEEYRNIINNDNAYLNKSQIKKLIKNKELKLKNGEVITDEALQGLKTYERKQNFYELYDVLKDTNNSVGNAIENIKESITPDSLIKSEKQMKQTNKILNIKRTKALNEYFSSLKENVKNYKLNKTIDKKTSLFAMQDILDSIENEKQNKAIYLMEQYDNQLFKKYDFLKGYDKFDLAFKDNKISFGYLFEHRDTLEYAMFSENQETIKKAMNKLKEKKLDNTEEFKYLNYTLEMLMNNSNTKSTTSIEYFINDLNSQMENVNNKYKTSAVKKYYFNKHYETVKNQILNPVTKEEKEFSNSIIKKVNNMVPKEPTASDINYLGFYHNNDFKNINASNKNSAKASIHKIANKEVGKVKNKTIHNQRKRKTLQNMSKSMYTNNVIKKTELDNIMKMNTPNAIVDYLADIYTSTLQDVKKHFSLNDLLDKEYIDTLVEDYDFVNKKSHIPKDKITKEQIAYRNKMNNLKRYNNMKNKEKIYAFNKNGYKIDNTNLDKLVSTKSFQNFVGTTANTKNTKDFSKFNNIFFNTYNKKRKFNNSFNEETIKLLKDFGYNKKEIKNMELLLFNPKVGLIGKHDFGVSFYTLKDKNQNQLMMSISNKKHSSSVLNDIMNNTKPKKAVNLEMKQIFDFNNDLRTVKTGSIHKLITKDVSVFASNKPYEAPAYMKLRAKMTDTIDKANEKVLLYNTNTITKGIENEWFDETSKIIQNRYTNVLINAPGATGTKNIPTDKGLIKTFIPAPSDIENAKLIKTEGLINYVPFLYEVDEDFKKFADKKLKPTNGKETKDFIENWKKDLEKKKYKSLSENNKLEMHQAHELIMNMSEGQDIIGKLAKHADKLPNEYMGKDLKELNKLHISQVVDEVKATQGYVRASNALESIVFSTANDQSRPTGLQKLNSKLLDVTKYRENPEEMKELTKRSISLGSDITTDQYININNNIHNIPKETLDNLDPSLKKYITNRDFENEITGNMAMLSSQETLERLNYLNAKELKKKYNFDFNDETIKKAIDDYKYISSTFEQHGLINPYAYFEFFNEHELLSEKINDTFEFNKDITHGSMVSPNQVIGSYTKGDGEKIKIRNNSKQNAIIEGISDDRLYFNPIKPQVAEIKGNYGGVEKSVFSIPDNNENKRKLYEAIWNEAFGEDILYVANPEIAKHESGSIMFGSPLMKIKNKVSKLDKEEFGKYTEEFVDVMNKSFGEDYIKVVSDNNVIKTTTSNVLNENIHFDDATSNVVQYYKDKYRNKAMFDFLNDDKTNIKNIPNSQIKRTTFSRTLMSESHPTSGKFNTHKPLQEKGIKIDNRLTQNLSAFFTEDTIDKLYTNKDNKIVSKTDVIKDYLKDLSKAANNKTVKEGMKDSLNIYHAVNRVIDENYKNANIKEVNFNDLDIIPKGGLTASDLDKTVLSKDADADIFKINLPEGINVEVNKKKKNYIVVPKVSTHEVDGITYLSDTHKTIADLLNTINDAVENNTSKYDSPQEMIKDINNKNTKMFKAFKKDLTEKDGILYKNVLSNRIPFSGNLLAQSVVPVEKKQDGSFNFIKGNEIKGAIKKKGNKALYYDVVETSETALENMGISFNKLGEELYKNNFYDNKEVISSLQKSKTLNKDLKIANQETYEIFNDIVNMEKADTHLSNKTINDYINNNINAIEDIFENEHNAKKFMKTNNKGYRKKFLKNKKNELFGSAFAEIGKSYMEKEGTFGLFIRYPTFPTTSIFVSKFKLSRNMNKNNLTARTTSYTAKKLNLDIDADNVGNILLGDITSKKNGDKHISVFNPESKQYRHLAKIHEAQAETNGVPGVGREKSWVEKSAEDIADAAKHTEDFEINPKTFVSTIKENKKELGIDNFKFNYTDEHIQKQIALKARLGKETIGIISTPSYRLRNTAKALLDVSEDTKPGQLFKNKKNMNKMLNLGKIYTLTDMAEQKPLNAKHSKFLQSGVPGVSYGKALDIMASGETGSLEEGKKLLLDSIEKMGLYKNDFEKEQLTGAVDAVQKLFKNEKAREVYNSYIGGANKQVYKGPTTIFNTLTEVDPFYETLKEIAINPESIPDSETSKEFKNLFITRFGTDDYKNVKKLKNNVYVNNKNSLGISPGIYNIDNKSINKKSDKVNIKFNRIDPSTNKTVKTVNVTGNNSNDLINKIKSTFSSDNKLIDGYIEDSLDNYNTLIKNKAISEFVSTKNTKQDAKDILKKYDINDLSSDTLVKYKNNIDSTTKSIHNLANDYFNSQRGKDTINFSKEVKALNNKGYISNSEGSKLIKQFNDEIIKKGANYDRTSRSLFENALLLNDKNLSQNNINNVINTVKVNKDKIKYSKNKNTSNIMSSINSTKIYDLEDAKQKLNQNLKNNINSIDKDIFNVYKDSTLDLAKQSMVDTPLAELAVHNKKNLENLNINISNLLDTDKKAAYTYLNWKDNLDIIKGSNTEEELFNILGDSKIGYGKYTNVKIKNVGPTELLNIQKEFSKNSPIKNVMEETNARINNYLSIATNKHINLDNVNTKQFINAKIEDNIIFNVDDINQSIRKAGKNKKHYRQQKIAKMKQETIEESIKKIDTSDFKFNKSLLIGGAALTLTAGIIGYQYTNDKGIFAPEHKTNDYNSPIQNNTNNVANKHTAPSTPKKAIIEKNDGIKYSISAKGNNNKRPLLSSIKSLFNRFKNVNISLHETDNTTSIDDSWINEKLSDVLRS